MKKILAFIFLFIITISLFSQEKYFFYEKKFIKKITKKYKKYEKRYIPAITKIVLDSLKEINLDIDSIDIILIPTINYKKKTVRFFFKPDTTKFFYYLNPKKLYFGEAYIFYKKEYIGYIVVTESLIKPNLIYVFDTTSGYCENYLFHIKKYVKYQVNNRYNLIFYIEGNNKYCDILERKTYNNIEKLNITPVYGIWYNKIKYIGAK